MPVFEATYTISPTSIGDTGGEITGLGGPTVQDPTRTFESCGRQAKPGDRRVIYTRYNVTVPKNAVIRKAKVTHTAQQNAHVNAAFGFYRIGLIEPDGLWDVDGWTVANYPLESVLPNPTGDANGIIITGRLVGDVFFAPLVAYTTAQYFAGNVVTVGEGYTGLTFTLTDMVSQLQAWIQSSDYDPDGPNAGATGVVLDNRTVLVLDEQFWIYMDDDPIEPGQTLTIEWEIPGAVDAACDVFPAVDAKAETFAAVSGEAEAFAAVMADCDAAAAVDADCEAFAAVTAEAELDC